MSQLEKQFLLNWKTEKEVCTGKLLVERSTGGRNVSTESTINAGNQPGATLYSYTDAGVNTLAAPLFYQNNNIAKPVSKRAR